MPLNKNEIKSTFPLPAYNYRVTIMTDGNATVVGFSEVSGLSQEYASVTYKHGLSYIAGSRIIPGMRQPIRVTLKRGIVQSGNYLYEWFDKAHNEPGYDTAKRDIVIDLCNEVGEPVVRWTIESALPLKLDASSFDANTNDVAIETLELTAHSLQVKYNP